jgi:hypothetical protein
VAAFAFVVVETAISDNFLVRIMAGDAPNTFIQGARFVALAACEPVRLKPDIIHVMRPVRSDFLPRSVALSAEARHLFAVKQRQLRRQHSRNPIDQGAYVPDGVLMTSVALHAWLDLISSYRGVTSKTSGRFHFLQRSAGSGREVVRR